MMFVGLYVYKPIKSVEYIRSYISRSSTQEFNQVSFTHFAKDCWHQLVFFVRVKFRGIFQDIRRPMVRPVINSGDSLLVGKPEMMGKTYTVRHLFGVILNII